MAEVAIIGGAALSAFGAISGGRAASKAAKANAAADAASAAEAKALTDLELERHRVNTFRMMGGIRAAVGASGGVATDALDVLADSAAQSELDALIIRYGGEAQANAFLRSADLNRSRASSARTASYFSAASDLLLGGAGAYDAYLRRA